MITTYMAAVQAPNDPGTLFRHLDRRVLVQPRELKGLREGVCDMGIFRTSTQSGKKVENSRKVGNRFGFSAVRVHGAV